LSLVEEILTRKALNYSSSQVGGDPEKDVFSLILRGIMRVVMKISWDFKSLRCRVQKSSPLIFEVAKLRYIKYADIEKEYIEAMTADVFNVMITEIAANAFKLVKHVYRVTNRNASANTMCLHTAMVASMFNINKKAGKWLEEFEVAAESKGDRAEEVKLSDEKQQQNDSKGESSL
jgi:hypothetical protein